MNETNNSADPKLVEKLGTLLDQARRGELTGFVTMSFRENDGVDLWGHLTRREDIQRSADQVEALHALTTGGGARAAG